jgi:hypothetical protein
MSQPQQINIFQRTWHDLQTNPNLAPMSRERLIFEACILTIYSIVSLLASKSPWDILQEDLADYAYALVDIRQCFRFLSISPVGTQYPFSKLIYPLEQAQQFLGEALGQPKVHAKNRTKNMQQFMYWLEMTLEQVKGLDEPPP